MDSVCHYEVQQQTCTHILLNTNETKKKVKKNEMEESRMGKNGKNLFRCCVVRTMLHAHIHRNRSPCGFVSMNESIRINCMAKIRRRKSILSPSLSLPPPHCVIAAAVLFVVKMLNAFRRYGAICYSPYSICNNVPDI